MKLQIVAIAAFAIALGQCVSANAALSIASAVGGHAKDGANYVTFDKLALGDHGGTTVRALNTTGSADNNGKRP